MGGISEEKQQASCSELTGPGASATALYHAFLRTCRCDLVYSGHYIPKMHLLRKPGY